MLTEVCLLSIGSEHCQGVSFGRSHWGSKWIILEAKVVLQAPVLPLLTLQWANILSLQCAYIERLQWSYQSFLWLSQAQGPAVAQVFLLEHKWPTPLLKKKIYRISKDEYDTEGRIHFVTLGRTVLGWYLQDKTALLWTTWLFIKQKAGQFRTGCCYCWGADLFATSLHTSLLKYVYHA